MECYIYLQYNFGIYSNNKFLFKTQATIWKNKKQIVFLHNVNIEKSIDHIVKCWVKSGINH